MPVLSRVLQLPSAALARWRWHQLLRSCDFDPDTAGPLSNLPAGDFLIAGCPRSGTSLLAAMLFQPPRIVTVVEPWDGLRMAPAQLVSSLRAEVSGGMLRRGRLDVAALRDRREVRWQRDGEQHFPVAVDPGFALGVKWPAYWRLLPYLPETKFLICVRDPREVLASFEATGGRLSRGLEYDVALNRAMNAQLAAATDHDDRRRALLYQYVAERVAPHVADDNVLLVRFERWFEDAPGQLADIAAFLGVDLEGEPTVELEPPQTSPQRSLANADLVRELCPAAADMGYEV